MLADNEISVSTVSLLASKLTEANMDFIFKNIRNKTTREARALLSRVDKNGKVHDREEVVEVLLTLKASEFELLKRAREILSAKGKALDEKEVILKSLEELIERRDPVKKALRSLKKKAPAARQGEKETATDKVRVFGSESVTDESFTIKNNDSMNVNFKGGFGDSVKDESGSVTAEGASLGNNDSISVNSDKPESPVAQCSQMEKLKRSYIPMNVIHQVMLRDNGQCTYVYPDGTRCDERGMLEVDHFVPVCRGGSNELSNLQLSCRCHNQHSASVLFNLTSLKKYYS